MVDRKRQEDDQLDDDERDDERDDDERDDERDDDERDDDERDDDERDDDERDDDQDRDEDEPSESDGDDDERAAAIGRSLGVVEDEKAADEAEPSAEEAAPNRAARRRQRAIERRGGKAGAAGLDSEASDEQASAKPRSARERERDRNKRLRDDLLERRRAAAKRSAEPAQQPVQGLAASEVAEDVLARTGAATFKWLRRHSALAGWAVFGVVVVAAAVVYYLHRSQTSTAAASDMLAAAVLTDQAMVLPPEEDSRTDEQKAVDTRTFFPSVAERDKAALAAFERVGTDHAGTGAAILARLGMAGVLLDERNWDGALEAYAAVLASPLAPVDDDVRARALEGQAFAKEGKGDADGALADFQQLEEIAGFKALGLYHRARVLNGPKKQPDEAKKLLVQAREILDKATIEARASGTEAPSRWLSRATEELLRAIDPSALPQKPPSLGPDLSPEQIQKLLGQQGLSIPGAPGGPGQ